MLGVSAPMQARLDEYGSYHRAFGNEVCHVFGIPCIIVGAATLLGLVPVARVGEVSLSLAELVTGAIILFYLISARGLGLVTGTLMAILVFVGLELPVVAGAALFFGGWAVQFIGHAVYEKRSPAFLRNLLHLLVGPAWLVERALARLRPAH